MQKFLLIAIATASLCASLFGLGISNQSVFTPRSSNGRFVGIHADGWTEQQAQISLLGLAEVGNRVTLHFDPWRPAGVGPAHLKIGVCGNQIAEFLLTAEAKSVTVSLSGECQPRVISIEGVNPFLPVSSTDQRQLTAQFKKAEITSAIGVPLVDLSLIAEFTLGIFITSIVFLALLRTLFSNGAIRFLTLAIPLFSFLLIVDTEKINQFNLIYLWFCLSVVLIGVYLGRRNLLGNDASAKPPHDQGGVFVALLITIAGGLLRAHGIDFGLPSNFHPDEVPKVNAIMRMVDSGSLNPQYFLHPSLLLYCTYAVNLIYQNLIGIDMTFRESAFLAGRTVSAIAGTVSIFTLFFIGRRLFGKRAGLLSAAMLAVFPLHVACSRYMKEDALLVCMVLLCTTVMLYSVHKDRPAILLLAGFIAGISFSSKYSGLLSGAIVCAAPWLRSGNFIPDKRFTLWAIAGLCMLPLGFMVCTPYSVITPDVFRRDFNSESNHMSKGHTVALDSWSQLWMFHYSHSIIPGASLAATALATLAIGYLLARGKISELFIVAMILLFYLPAEWVKAKPAPQPERYILPCLPFMAIAGAAVLTRLNSKVIAFLIAVAVIAFPAVRSFQMASELKPDTRELLSTWVRENIPPGSKIMIDYPRYSPEFRKDEYNVYYILRGRIVDKLSVRSLKQSGQDYLILSSLFYERYFSQPQGALPIRQQFRELFAGVPILKQFQPRYGTYGFHNPTVTIFSLKPEDFAALEAELADKKAGKIQFTSNEVKGNLGVESW